MPIYEYECRKCGEHIEVEQKITAPPILNCNFCGGDLKKLITSTAFILKGSGWYVTDYPSPERKKAIESKEAVSTKKDTGLKKTANTNKEKAAKVQ